MEGSTIFEVMGYTWGRETKMGALTGFVPLQVERGQLKIIVTNRSNTGRHWFEKLCLTKDFTGVVARVDITNSGKHRCEKYVYENGLLVDVISPPGQHWVGECPVCGGITKAEFEERRRGYEVVY